MTGANPSGAVAPGVARASRPWQLCCCNKARSSNYAWTHVMTGANPSGAVAPGVARVSRPWTIMLLQQSAFFKLRMDARQAQRQPLRRCRATSPCRGGFSCRENWSAVFLRPCTTARHDRRHPPQPPQKPPSALVPSRARVSLIGGPYIP